MAINSPSSSRLNMSITGVTTRDDGLWQLVEVSGREHPGQGSVAGQHTPPTTEYQHRNDGKATRISLQDDFYDAAGNIRRVGRQASDQTQPESTQTYRYAERHCFSTAATWDVRQSVNISLHWKHNGDIQASTPMSTTAETKTRAR